MHGYWNHRAEVDGTRITCWEPESRFVDEQIAFTRKMVKAMHPVFVKLDTVPKPEPKAKATVTRMAPKKAA